METYHVMAEFDINISDTETLQQFAHAWYESRYGSTPVESTFVDNPQQAADHVAQNLNWAVTVLMEQVLAHGINAVVAMAPELGGSSTSNLSMTNTAPSGPA